MGLCKISACDIGPSYLNVVCINSFKTETLRRKLRHRKTTKHRSCLYKHICVIYVNICSYFYCLLIIGNLVQAYICYDDLDFPVIAASSSP